jgi:hypothetical protein
MSNQINRDDFVKEIIVNSVKPANFKDKLKAMMLMLVKLMRKIVGYLTSSATW